MGDLGKESDGVRGEGAVLNLHCGVCGWKCVYVCVDEASRQLDGCSVTRSPRCSRKASHGQCRALASVSQKLNVLALSKQMLNAISRSCLCVCMCGGRGECVCVCVCVWMDAHSVFVCVSMCFRVSVHFVFMSVCECISFQTDVFFSNMCVLAESDQHQPVQWVWPRWIIFSTCCGQYYTRTHAHTHNTEETR